MYTKVLRGHIRHSTISLVHHLICLQVKSSQATFSRTIVTPQPSLQKDVCTCCKITISLPWCMQKPQMSSGPAVINSFNGAYSTPFTQSVCKPLVHIYMDGLVASTDLTVTVIVVARSKLNSKCCIWPRLQGRNIPPFMPLLHILNGNPPCKWTEFSNSKTAVESLQGDTAPWELWTVYFKQTRNLGSQ